jgi:glycosyltransferase involved in cell wall biosynthesis
VLTNGYDPEEIANVKPHNVNLFAIVYTGTFYPPKRVITPVMAALSLLQNRRPNLKWEFHYYGPHGDHVRQEGERFHLMKRIILHGNVPREEALGAVGGAGLNVVITSVFPSNSIEDDGIVPGKLFEAIGLGTPILLVTPQTSDACRISQQIPCVRPYSGEQLEKMSAFIADTLCKGMRNTTGTEVYAWPNLILQLDKILRSVALKQDDHLIYRPDIGDKSEFENRQIANV